MDGGAELNRIPSNTASTPPTGGVAVCGIRKVPLTPAAA